MADESLEWETIESETTYTCPGFDIQQDTVQLPEGNRTTFDYLIDDESVVIIPFTADGELIVIEEWRQAVKRVSRGFPAGGVEPEDPSLSAAAHRELTEETGYIADTTEHVISVEPANGISNAVHHFFVAEDCVQNGERDLDENESIRVATTSFEHLLEKVRAGEVRDGRTVLGTLYYETVRCGSV